MDRVSHQSRMSGRTGAAAGDDSDPAPAPSSRVRGDRLRSRAELAAPAATAELLADAAVELEVDDAGSEWRLVRLRVVERKPAPPPQVARRTRDRLAAIA
jgi:hypothetical protein